MTLLWAIGIGICSLSNVIAQTEPIRRQPVALDFGPVDGFLYCGNASSGTVSQIDVVSTKVRQEFAVAPGLTDLIATTEGIFATSAATHEALLLDPSTGQITSRLAVAAFPQSLVWQEKNRRLLLAGLWSREVQAIDFADGELQVARSLKLPFEPREILATEDGKWLLVASAFRAQLAVIDTSQFTLQHIHSLGGHNIGGMAIQNDRLWLTMQQLSPLAHSTRDDVHWGNMISNLLTEIPLAAVLSEGELRPSQIEHALGEPGAGAGDPGALAVADQRVFIAIEGTNEVVTTEKGESIARSAVGIRPAAVACSSTHLAVANRFSDTVSLMDSGQPEASVVEISLGESRTLTSIEKGELLFTDSRLSHDGWMSCHSCHTDGHSNGQLNDNLSDGGYGAAKRVPSLLGVAHTEPWSWLGQVDSLEQQVESSIESTMQGKALSKEQVGDLVAFMQSLAVPVLPPDSHASEVALVKNLERGREVFAASGCQNCHAGEHFTTPKTYDVGLQDAVGNLRFNPPSLRGIGYRDRFFHDARAKSLAEVFEVYGHQLAEPLSTKDLQALLAYLESLD